jgi:hypothetical protein
MGKLPISWLTRFLGPCGYFTITNWSWTKSNILKWVCNFNLETLGVAFCGFYMTMNWPKQKMKVIFHPTIFEVA